ncbi:uncharacterized protein LOC123301553 isoform X2 [Chrysoperla carnea]|uniref:uncharacterized protein LOC123301553 isoform X2 n=1 Tax=Chrysoperla carnea TaxID=189513 RepID=UPI001D078090|nr:uncharacterized protein LOC123301553 isoform X2 [Chrysoperla carnea]
MQNSRKTNNDLPLTSCIRLSPYKKWSTPAYQHVISDNMESLARNSGRNNMTTRNAVSALNSSPIKDNILYEPYKMRPIKPSISIVHRKHLSASSPTKDTINNDLVVNQQYPQQSPHHSHPHRVKTDLKSSSPGSGRSGRERGGGYLNGTTSPVQLSENYSPNDYIDPPIESYGQSTFRKIIDNRADKNGLSVGIIEASSHEKSQPQFCQILENNSDRIKNIKCGNSSCNGSEPLKETHITGNNMATDQRFHDEVALLRGKVRELSKNKSSLTQFNSINNQSKIFIKKEKNHIKNGEKPRKLPVKRSPVYIKHVPKIVNLQHALEIEDKPGIELREKVIIVENPTPRIIKNTRQRTKNTEIKTLINEIVPKTSSSNPRTSPIPQSVSPQNSLTPPVSLTPRMPTPPTTPALTVPNTRSLRSGSSPSGTSGSSPSGSRKPSPLHVVAKEERPVTPLQEVVNGTQKESGNITRDVEKPVQPHSKLRKKTKDLNSDSESELSDSECTDPDEVDAEEKQINYETVLSELVTIRNDLYLSYTTNNEFLRQSPTIGESGDTVKQLSVLRPSLFPNVPPYLRFYPHDQAGPKLPATIQRQLKWRLSNITPVIVRKTLINSGFRLTREENNDWIGIWGKHIKSPLFKHLKDHQKMNHFPGTFQLGRKDRLWRNTQKLQIKFGIKEFDYVPKTYILPQDLKQLRHVWEKGEGVVKWILKPPASARGSGIRVVNKWNQIPKKKPLVVQRYIDNPYLINGSKFDLRLYVLLTSFDPLRIYLYPDGLARFASVKYSSDSNSLDNRYMHLTNYSINKLSRDYTANEDAGACQGHKWTIQALWDYLSKNGVNTSALWATLQDLVIKTIISGESGITQLLRGNVGSRYNCYELFGVDVLLDEHLKPWLLEVNISPSLHSTSPLDLYVKGPLVQTLLNMAQYHIPTDTLTQQQRSNVLKNLGMNKTSRLFSHQQTTNTSSSSPPSPSSKTTTTTNGSPGALNHKQKRHYSTNGKVNGHGGHHDDDDDDKTNGDDSAASAGGDYSMFDIPLSFDGRIYTLNLSTNERLKQNIMTSYQHRSDYLEDILTNLTPDDVRHLIIAEDELQAAGKFQKIFPTKNTYHYLSLMEPRYYDRLFDAWEHKYSSNKILGIGLLQACCARKYHLIVPPTPKIMKENTPQETQEKCDNPITVENYHHHLQHQAVHPLTHTPIPSTGGTTMLDEEGPNQKSRPRFVRRRRRYVYGGYGHNNYGRVTFKHYPSVRYTTRYLVRKRKSRPLDTSGTSGTSTPPPSRRQHFQEEEDHTEIIENQSTNNS